MGLDMNNAQRGPRVTRPPSASINPLGAAGGDEEKIRDAVKTDPELAEAILKVTEEARAAVKDGRVTDEAGMRDLQKRLIQHGVAVVHDLESSVEGMCV